MENTSMQKKPTKPLIKKPIKKLAPRTVQPIDELEEAVNASEMDYSDETEFDELEMLDEVENHDDFDCDDTTENAEERSSETTTKKPIVSNTIRVTDDDSDELEALVSRASPLQFGSSGIRGGLISVVYSPQSIRLAINKAANEKLGYPTEIYFGCEGEYLFMFNSQGTSFEGKKISSNNKGKLLIYDAALVKSIVETFDLDYSNVTSKSFAEGYFKDKGRPVLYVKMV